eukprot:Skav232547  [mRNA]  locus=scaffold7124:19874:25012:+ [translate_table: standard]
MSHLTSALLHEYRHPPNDTAVAVVAVGQAELLELLSPPPFNQKKCVPPDAVILTSPEERWWRSDSPRLPGDSFPDVPPPKQSPGSPWTLPQGHGLRSGPILFQTTAQTGCGTAAHFKMEDTQGAGLGGVSSWWQGGHFPGKQGANIIGATFDKCLALETSGAHHHHQQRHSGPGTSRSYTESVSHTISLGK